MNMKFGLVLATMVFAGAGSAIDLVGERRTVGPGNLSAAGGYSNSSGSITDLVIDIPAGETTVFNGTIAGAIRVVKLGKGALHLGGDNAYTGGTVVSNGDLRALCATAFGTGAVTGAGGTVTLGAEDAAFANDFAFATGKSATFRTAAACALTGNVDSAVPLNLCDVDSAKTDKISFDVHFAGKVSVRGTLTWSKYGSGTYWFDGPLVADGIRSQTVSSYKGPVRLTAPKAEPNDFKTLHLEYGDVWCDAANALPAGATIDFMTGATWSEAKMPLLYLNGFDQTADRIVSMQRQKADTGSVSDMAVDNTNRRHATLTLKGSANAVAWSRLQGDFDLVWDAADPANTQSFVNSTNTISGMLYAKCGRLEISGAAAFRQLQKLKVGPQGEIIVGSTSRLSLMEVATLEIADGGRLTVAAEAKDPFYPRRLACLLGKGATLALPAGYALKAASVTTNGAVVADGVYAGQGAAAEVGVTSVPWIVGEGRLTIGAGKPDTTPRVIAVEPGAGALNAAFAEVAAYRANEVYRPVELALKGGVYAFPDGLAIPSAVASREFAKLTVRAADPANRPVFTALKPVVGWQREANYNGRTDVWSADVSALGSLTPSNLVFYCAGRRMSVAATPNPDPDHPYSSVFAIADDARYDSDSPKTCGDRLPIRAADASRFAFAKSTEGWVIARPRHNWSTTLAPLAGVEDGWLVFMSGKTSCESASGLFDQYAVCGLRETLDRPGEWYLDTTAKRLYFIPPAGTDPSASDTGLAVTAYAVTASGLANISFENLDFRCARAGLKLNLCRNAEIHACSFFELGGYDDMSVYAAGEHLAVTDCDVGFCSGMAGIRVADGNLPSTVDARSDVWISNNYVHNLLTDNPQCNGIQVSNVQGVHVTHNLIHDIPRCGICSFGRMNEFSYNRIRHTNLFNNDSGAIYGGGWVNGVGTVVCYNHIADSVGYGRNSDGTHGFRVGTCGIYCDEGSGGVTIFGNFVKDCHNGALHLHSARAVTISNNVFVSNATLPVSTSGKQLSIQTWYGGPNGTMGSRSASVSATYRKFVVGDPRWAEFPSIAQTPLMDETTFNDDEMDTVIRNVRVVRNVFVYPDQARTSSGKASPVYSVRYLNTDLNLFDRNLFWPGAGVRAEDISVLTGASPSPRLPDWQALGEDVHSIVADPQMEAPDSGVFRLAAGSPAFGLGFEELPYGEMGPTTSVWRTALPVAVEGVREHPEWIDAEPAEKDDPGKPFYTKVGVDGIGASSFVKSLGTAVGWAPEGGRVDMNHSPGPENDYAVPTGTILRTPKTGGKNYTFGGASLLLSGLLAPCSQGTSTLTITNLTVEDGLISTRYQDDMTVTLAGDITIPDGKVLRISHFANPKSGKHRSLTFAAPVSGAGNIDFNAGGYDYASNSGDVLVFAGDMSAFTGAIESWDEPNNAAIATEYRLTNPDVIKELRGGKCFVFKITGAFAGTIGRLDDIPSPDARFVINYGALADGAKTGLKVSVASVPKYIDTCVTFYNVTDPTAADLPLITFPAGTPVDPAVFMVKSAANEADASAGNGTAFGCLGVITNADGTLTLVANHVSAPAWDIPGVSGGINGFAGTGDAKSISFAAIKLTANGLRVDLSAARIDANGETFGLICKTDLTSDATIVVNATLTAEPNATEGVFTANSNLSAYPRLFVIGIGPAAK